jgi:hypothetical protein
VASFFAIDDTFKDFAYFSWFKSHEICDCNSMISLARSCLTVSGTSSSNKYACVFSSVNKQNSPFDQIHFLHPIFKYIKVFEFHLDSQLSKL